MTELEALERMFAAAWLPPPSSVPDSGNGLARRAVEILRRESLDIQKRGWAFNTRENVTLTRQGDNTVIVPDTVISIKLDPNRAHAIRREAKVGARLYDTDNNTFEWDIDPIVSYTLRYDFDCIPEHISQWIQAEAALRLIEAHIHTANKGSMINLARDERDRKRAEAQNIETELHPKSFFNTTFANEILGDRNWPY